MTLRVMMSAAAQRGLAAAVTAVMGGRPYRLVPPEPGQDADVAFVSRDITGLSTKHDLTPDTERAYDALLGATSLRWVHVHSAGADRPVYLALRRRGVKLTTSSGANAAVVAQTAVGGLLALARHFPALLRAQAEGRWTPLLGDAMPRDLSGQTAVIVGWGPIGQRIGRALQALELRVIAVRASRSPAGGGIETVDYEHLADVLPRADWLILACPLTDRTRQLIDAAALGRLPAGARLLNVARGDVVVEPALIAALASGRLAGAFLDVFAHEPLPADSPLWSMPAVIVTPHSAGFSDGNAGRVADIFLDNLRRWVAGMPLQCQDG